MEDRPALPRKSRAEADEGGIGLAGEAKAESIVVCRAITQACTDACQEAGGAYTRLILPNSPPANDDPRTTSSSDPGRLLDADADTQADSMNGSQSRNPSGSATATAMHDGRGRRPSQANLAQAQAQTSSPPMTRAERFEDEKRRLVDSCFSKLDQNGQRMLHARLHALVPR